MKIEEMGSLASRTGRQFQRYIQGCRQVVGCIPFRLRKTHHSRSIHGTLIDDLEVLMISSQKSPRLMFPKGGWEIDESTMEEAASRETMEEAGVQGIVGCQLGSWSFTSKSLGTCNEGYMFPLLVTKQCDDWPEKNSRQRIWMSVHEAREKCVHLWMKEALDIFVDLAVRVQRTEEENRTACLLEFLRMEVPRIGIVAQNGEEEVDRCLVS